MIKDTMILTGGITGSFSLEVYKNGKLVETFIEKNLVVMGGKANAAKLMGGDAAGKKIEKISVGTSNIPPVDGDAALTGAFTKAIATVSYPETNSVQFNFTIEDTEANGMTIREFGLLNTDNTLCARKVRADIVKTSGIRLVGTWKITIN